VVEVTSPLRIDPRITVTSTRTTHLRNCPTLGAATRYRPVTDALRPWSGVRACRVCLPTPGRRRGCPARRCDLLLIEAAQLRPGLVVRRLMCSVCGWCPWLLIDVAQIEGDRAAGRGPPAKTPEAQ
jgi:hypothetical protein